jgi:diguanylate cyclase (GGDEF)-like protein
MPEINVHLPIGGPVLKHQCFYQLNAEHEKLGEIRISNSAKFTEFELSMVEVCLSHLLYPLRNALLYREAIRNARQDALTGVGNRFSFSRAFEREQRLAQRYHQDLSLLVIDIDFFKRINDQHGHSCGDEVLKSVAQCLQSVMRQTDMIFRYGGEEFTAILTKTNREGAQVIAERIRVEVEKLTVQLNENQVKTTVSIGIGSLNEAKDSQALFNQADDNLYLAKRNGRNRVC